MFYSLFFRKSYELRIRILPSKKTSVVRIKLSVHATVLLPSSDLLSYKLELCEISRIELVLPKIVLSKVNRDLSTRNGCI